MNRKDIEIIKQIFLEKYNTYRLNRGSYNWTYSDELLIESVYEHLKGPK